LADQGHVICRFGQYEHARAYKFHAAGPPSS
jgi:hypothetical protein